MELKNKLDTINYWKMSLHILTCDENYCFVHPVLDSAASTQEIVLKTFASCFHTHESRLLSHLERNCSSISKLVL